MFQSSYIYYLTIALQLICVIHCLKKGNEQKWIYIIIFLPVIGCIAYVYTEIFSKRAIVNVQSGIGAVFNPPHSIKKLEQNLKFSDTFNNRILLADAYLAAGQIDRAIELYKSSLTGAFEENEHIQNQLIQANFAKEDYEEVILLGRKIYKQPQFTRSSMHLLFARALAYNGHLEDAEKEFKTMSGRFANYEARYYFATILLKTDKSTEGIRLLQSILEEAPHLSSMERSANRVWFGKAKTKLKEVAA